MTNKAAVEKINPSMNQSLDDLSFFFALIEQRNPKNIPIGIIQNPNIISSTFAPIMHMEYYREIKDIMFVLTPT